MANRRTDALHFFAHLVKRLVARSGKFRKNVVEPFVNHNLTLVSSTFANNILRRSVS